MESKHTLKDFWTRYAAVRVLWASTHLESLECHSAHVFLSWAIFLPPFSFLPCPPLLLSYSSASPVFSDLCHFSVLYDAMPWLVAPEGNWCFCERLCLCWCVLWPGYSLLLFIHTKAQGDCVPCISFPSYHWKHFVSHFEILKQN